jgi:16S rRNA processing protein RimM
MHDLEELIPVGKIIDTHGIKGQVKVHSYSGNADSLGSARSVILKNPAGTLSEFSVKGFKANSGRFIITLAGLDDINVALPYVGNEICLKRCQLPELDEDEFYWSDLIGLQVMTEDNTLLGKIADIFETGSNDVYVVRDGAREYLIPAIAEVIKTIDPVEGKVVIRPLDGLLEL